MPALKRAALLVALAACEGPTLNVGDLQLLDAGEPDAATVVTEPSRGEVDAGSILMDAAVETPFMDAGRIMDAGHDARVRDADPGEIPWFHRCSSDDDCRDTYFPRCNTHYSVCMGCKVDRDCREDQRCDTSRWFWYCRNTTTN